MKLRDHQLDSPRLVAVTDEVTTARGSGYGSLAERLDALSANAGGGVRSFEELAPASGSTALTLTYPYAPDSERLLLFYNGVLLKAGTGADFREIDGTLLSLNFATLPGDRFTAIVFGQGADGGTGGSPAASGEILTAMEQRLRQREIEHLKTMLEIDTLKAASKHKLVATVTDTFSDRAGIDPVLSDMDTLAQDKHQGIVYMVPALATERFQTSSAGGVNVGFMSYHQTVAQSFQVKARGYLKELHVFPCNYFGNPGDLYVRLRGALDINPIYPSSTVISPGIKVCGTDGFTSDTWKVVDFSSRQLMLEPDRPYWFELYCPFAEATAGKDSGWSVWASNGYPSKPTYPEGDRVESATTGDGALADNNGAWRYVGAADLWFEAITTPVSGADHTVVVSTADQAVTQPDLIYLGVQEQLNAGSIDYYVSRDDGVTWIPATKDGLTNVGAAPPGTKVRARAVIRGDAQLQGWGYGWY